MPEPLLGQADFHYVLDLEELRSVMGRGHPGSRCLRRASAAHLPQLAKTETPLEDEFMLLCERFGLPLPEPNVWIGRFRVDALWPSERVITRLRGPPLRLAPGAPSAAGSSPRRP